MREGGPYGPPSRPALNPEAPRQLGERITLSGSVGLVTNGWGELDGVAQIAAAGGTLVLAAFTWWLGRRTHELAVKADDQVRVAGEQAEAARQEAKATEALAREQRTDRQLAWRPQLERIGVWTRTVTEQNGETRVQRTCWVRNSGAGPALNVVTLIRDIADVRRWWICRCGDLRPGEGKERSADLWQHGKSLTAVFDGFADCGDRHVVTFVMLCSDVLGRRFRFGIADPKDPFPGEPTKVLAAEISELAEGGTQHSGWAGLPLIWG